MNERRGPSWGYLLLALLLAFAAYELEDDVVLDLIGVRGYAFVESTDCRSGHCDLILKVPTARQSFEPRIEGPPAQAFDAKVSFRATSDECAALKSTWQQFQYQEGNVSRIRRAEHRGGGITPALMILSVVGLFFGLRWVARRAKRDG